MPRTRPLSSLLLMALLCAPGACGGSDGGAGGAGDATATGDGGAGADASAQGSGSGLERLSSLPTSSLMLDVDGDGDLDLVIGDEQVDVILLNDGRGGFDYRDDLLPPHYLGPDGSTVSLAAGDFNLDGTPDILAVTVDARPDSFYGSSQLHLWLGDGTGAFTDATSSISEGRFERWPEWVRVGDFDGDGADDFLITEPGCGWEEVCIGGTIYLNDGTGRLAPQPITSTDAERSYTGPVLRWENDGNVQPGEGSARYALDVFVGDVDDDGRLDLVAPGSAEGAMATFINTSTPGSLTFDLVYTVDPVDPFSGAIPRIKNGALLDIDGDGLLDVVGSTAISGTREPDALLHAFINRGDGAFEPRDSIFLPTQPGVEHARQWLVADFNGDGRDDLFVADHGYDYPPFPGQPNLLLLSDGDGALVDRTAQSLSATSTYTHGASAGDVDGDGDVDLFLHNTSNAGDAFLDPASAITEPRLWLNQGDGTFRPLLPAAAERP